MSLFSKITNFLKSGKFKDQIKTIWVGNYRDTRKKFKIQWLYVDESDLLFDLDTNKKHHPWIKCKLIECYQYNPKEVSIQTVEDVDLYKDKLKKIEYKKK